MALQTPVITVDSVNIPQKSLFNITFRCVIDDDSVGLDGIDTTHSIRYRPGDKIADKTADVIAAFQKEIADYGLTKTLQASAGMTTAVATITSGLVV